MVNKKEDTSTSLFNPHVNDVVEDKLGKIFVCGSNSVEEAIAKRYADIMSLLEIPGNEDNADTPMRVAKALMEMTKNVGANIEELYAVCTTFPNRSNGVLVKVEDIEFTSMCSHHHLPFFGKVDIEYIPSERIIGLSKFDRIVEFFSRKPQVQEEFTSEVYQYILALLCPLYLKVVVKDSTHTCMCARGVYSRAKTSTELVYKEE